MDFFIKPDFSWEFDPATKIMVIQGVFTIDAFREGRFFSRSRELQGAFRLLQKGKGDLTECSTHIIIKKGATTFFRQESDEDQGSVLARLT